MAVDCFLDTNILLYAYDADAGEKRMTALKLVEQGWRQPGTVAISVQVLQEFYVNLARRRLPKSEIQTLVEDLCQWPVVDNALSLFGRGMAHCNRWQLSLWDAMIVAAAEASGAHRLITEDLNHGQIYGKVSAVNPF